MRIVILGVLLLAAVSGQNTSRKEPQRKPCSCSPDLLYQPVVHAMWAQNENEHPDVTANGFIRIAVRPAWDPEFFLDIRLNEDGPPTMVSYFLPKGSKTVTSLLENAVKENPCADVTTLARGLPVVRRKFTANKQTGDFIERFFCTTIRGKAHPQRSSVGCDGI
jgi:hypothetical protein